jgi:predicted ATPase
VVSRGAERPTDNLADYTPLTPLIGREAELAQLADHLEDRDCRLLTLVGPGGIGKTRLALQAAADQRASFRDGVCFVALAPVRAAEFVVPAIAGALGFTFHGTTEPKYQLIAYLRNKDMLLVLDNFEQLLASADVLLELVQAAPAVVLLVTSRESLNLRTEWLLDIPGLLVPGRTDASDIEQSSAVRLFAQTASRVRANFTLSLETTPSVAHICQLVAGVPLAIELAASWVRSRSCGEIARGLEQNLELLATTMQDVPTRHRSMRAVFDSSWRLLSTAERNVLCRISVFRGGLLEEAAAQVASATPAVLAALIDKSLLRRNSAGRYDLHELVRQYAHEQLQAGGEIDVSRRQHASYYLTLAAIIEPELHGAAQLMWLHRLEVEHDNFRAALEWAIAYREAAVALGLVGTLQRFWWVRGHLSEGRRWLGAALAFVEGAGLTSVHTKALNGAGILATFQEDFAAARGFYEQALRVGRTIEDSASIASALLGLGIVAQYQREYERAAALLEEGLAVAEGWHKGWMLFFLGVVAQAQCAYGRAAALVEESLALFREIQECVGIAEALHTLGWRALWQNADERAAALFAESLALFHELGDRRGIANCLDGWSALAGARGLAERASRLGGAAQAVRAAMNAPLSPSEHTDLEHSIAALRAALGEEGFDAAWADGQALTLEQAVDEALKEYSVK